MQGTEPDGSLAGNASGAPGLVTIVAAEPLLQPATTANSGFVLTLYGNPGSNYVLQSSTSLLGGGWQAVMSMTQTNVALQLNINTSNAPALFYRAYQETP